MTGVCSFCGHSSVPESVKAPLIEAIEALITENKVDCFYVGNHGGFDRMVLSALHEAKERHPSMQYAVVLAYMPGKKPEYQYADDAETIYPDGLEAVPRRYAITHRNRWLVDQAEYLIAYIDHDYGGAAQTLRYARGKKTVQIINIASGSG